MNKPEVINQDVRIAADNEAQMATLRSAVASITTAVAQLSVIADTAEAHVTASEGASRFTAADVAEMRLVPAQATAALEQFGPLIAALLGG